MSKITSFIKWLRRLPGIVWPVLRRHPKKSIAGSVVLLLIVLIILMASRPKQPEYITAEVQRGDLLQVVEAIGEVISERDLKLQFPITGVVAEVNVEEGDRVSAGQELARLRSSGLGADVNSAWGQVQSAKADLERLEQGTRPEEIAITEASVQNKRSSLEAARESLRSAERNLESSQIKLTALEREAETSLSGFVDTARSDVSKNLSTALTAIQVMDDVFNDNDLLDVFVKHEPHLYESARRDHSTARIQIDSILSHSLSISDYKEAIDLLSQARDTLNTLAATLNQTYSLVSSLEITPAFSNADREASKSTIATQRSAVQSALSLLDSSLKSLRDASANFDTRIRAEEAAVASALGARDRAMADIQTFETSLRMEEANLNLKIAGSRQQDIDAARGRLNQAYAQLQRAKERYADTIIVAPIDGKITKVNLKEGELLSTSFESSAAITMLGDSPYRIEMFISEIDIPKVMLTQSGSVELDAFPGQPFDLKVTELDPAATEVDGVSKYRAKLDFVVQQDQMKIGMTGDSEIFTDFREDVLRIPGRAVITQDGNDIVRVLVDGEIEEREVVVGMDGEGGDVEIVSGVEEGETIVVLIKD